MATQPIIDTPETGTDLLVVEAQRNAVALFTNEQQYDEFYQRVRDNVSDFVPDVTTDKGRREIASVAFRVTKAKTTLDKAGFALTEEWRKKTAAVNAARKKMTTQLDALADEVRRPLTEWEQKEAERDARVEQIIQKLRNSATVLEGDTADVVEERRRSIAAYVIADDFFQIRAAEARDTQTATLAALDRAVERLRQEEADRAELERLRKEAAEREERERAEREAREAQERAAQAEREAEERARREKEESDRRIREAEERAAREAEERARAEERREAEERLAEERRAREAAEAEAAETRRKEQERLAWEERERREREKREADARHRQAVVNEIAEDIAKYTTSDNTAAAIANAIAGGTIRHVRVTF